MRNRDYYYFYSKMDLRKSKILLCFCCFSCQATLKRMFRVPDSRASKAAAAGCSQSPAKTESTKTPMTPHCRYETHCTFGSPELKGLGGSLRIQVLASKTFPLCNTRKLCALRLQKTAKSFCSPRPLHTYKPKAGQAGAAKHRVGGEGGKG